MKSKFQVEQLIERSIKLNFLGTVEEMEEKVSFPPNLRLNYFHQGDEVRVLGYRCPHTRKSILAGGIIIGKVLTIPENNQAIVSVKATNCSPGAPSIGQLLTIDYTDIQLKFIDGSKQEK